MNLKRNRIKWKTAGFLLSSLLLIASFAFAIEDVNVKTLDSLLGKNYKQVYSQIGLPIQMFPVRQNDEIMDDIVMVYETARGPYYLYFYNNNFYRALIPSKSKADFYGINIGDQVSKLKEVYTDELEIKDNYAHYVADGRHYIFNIQNDKVNNIWMLLDEKPKVIKDE